MNAEFVEAVERALALHQAGALDLARVALAREERSTERVMLALVDALEDKLTREASHEDLSADTRADVEQAHEALGDLAQSVTAACEDRASDVEALADYLESDLRDENGTDLGALAAGDGFSPRALVARHCAKLRAAANEIRWQSHLSPASHLGELAAGTLPVVGPERELHDALKALAERHGADLGTKPTLPPKKSGSAVAKRGRRAPKK